MSGMKSTCVGDGDLHSLKKCETYHWRQGAGHEEEEQPPDTLPHALDELSPCQYVSSLASASRETPPNASMSSACSWRKMSMASSGSDDPDQYVRRIDNGDGDQARNGRSGVATASWSPWLTRPKMTSRCMISLDHGADRRDRISFLSETKPIRRRV